MRYYYNIPSLFDFDHIFDDFFAPLSESRFPRVDIYENDDAYVLEAEVAGYDPEKINVSSKDKVLTISAEEEEDKNEYLKKEIFHPSFSRSFSLPSDADENAIEALHKNGLLILSIKKIKKPEAKKIEVKIN